ncbi:type II restriction endonuclease [Tateyamaria sp. SN3-11]|uniref:type II restriction endonuclease n=1 Tax=Tateyamaria sp. SN3-11 TaxID=3092147 RepID=UPI0039E90573
MVMLAVKTTCNDRWRQVLAKADRIGEKHLLTLEPAISRAQTAEMQAQKLRLVLPRPLHETYHEKQRDWILDVAGFLRLARFGD